MDGNLVKKEAWQRNTNALIDDINNHDENDSIDFSDKKFNLAFLINVKTSVK